MEERWWQLVVVATASGEVVIEVTVVSCVGRGEGIRQSGRSAVDVREEGERGGFQGR